MPKNRRESPRKRLIQDALKTLGLPCLLDELRFLVWSIERNCGKTRATQMTRSYKNSFWKTLSESMDELDPFSFNTRERLPRGALVRATLYRLENPRHVQHFSNQQSTCVEVWTTGKHNALWFDDEVSRAWLKFAFLDAPPENGRRPEYGGEQALEKLPFYIAMNLREHPRKPTYHGKPALISVPWTRATPVGFVRRTGQVYVPEDSEILDLARVPWRLFERSSGRVRECHWREPFS